MNVPDTFTLRELDRQESNDWFNGDTYPKIAAYLKGKIGVCVDIGASSGYVSYYMLELIQPEFIICFEPDKASFELLQQNLSIYPNATVINKAIFYGKTTVRVNGTGDNNHLGYMIADIDEEHSGCWGDRLHTYPDKTFDCVELEEYVGTADLIKIDVEGSEYNLIENSRLIQNAKYILLETHNHERPYIEQYLSTHLPQHKIVFTQGIDIHLGFLLEKE